MEAGKEGGVMAKLTPKQKRFCEEYLIDLNATQGAIRAGYSPKTAYSIGQRMLKNVEVKNYIQKHLEKIQNEKIADAKEIMTYLTAVMRGEEKEEVALFCGEGIQELAEKEICTKDRLKAAELLGKRYGMFTEKLEIEGNATVQILDDIEAGEEYD